jgi:hypothetical protein
MELFMRSTSVVFITVFALLLSACGGEGGVLTQSNQASIANAGIDQTVLANSTVTLDGSASTDLENDASGTSLTYSWLQTDIRNPNEELNNINIATPSFEAPSVTETTVLQFTLTVTDSNNDSSTDDVLITVNVPVKLNDTGITTCSSGNSNGSPCPVAGHDGQDGDHGRDARFLAGEFTKVGAGRAGFDFTKLDAYGDPLAANASVWSCVQDNHTGLVWEVKTATDLHSKDDEYTWYNTDGTTNGGSAGVRDTAIRCSGYNANDVITHCNTQAFVARVNKQGLCGATNWRLPNKNELVSIIDFSDFSPAIDSEYFPNTKTSTSYWSSSSYASNVNGGAWVVSFFYGYDGYGSKSGSRSVRLVRGGQ